MGSTRSLKFDIYTTHGLLAEFRGLGVWRTHVTRRSRTTTWITPKSTLRGHNENLIVAQRQCLPIRDLATKILKFFSLPQFLMKYFFFRPRIFFRLNICLAQNSFWAQNFFGPALLFPRIYIITSIFQNTKLCWYPKMFGP